MPTKSKLPDAIASLLSLPAVRHAISVIVTLITGWLILRLGGMPTGMPAPVLAPVPTVIEAPVAPVEPPPAADVPAVEAEPEAASAPVLPAAGE